MGPQLVEKVSWGQLSAMDVLSAAVGMTLVNRYVDTHLCTITSRLPLYKLDDRDLHSESTGSHHSTLNYHQITTDF